MVRIGVNFISGVEGKKMTFKRCRLVVGGSAMALKIRAEEELIEANL